MKDSLSEKNGEIYFKNIQGLLVWVGLFSPVDEQMFVVCMHVHFIFIWKHKKAYPFQSHHQCSLTHSETGVFAVTLNAVIKGSKAM